MTLSKKKYDTVTLLWSELGACGNNVMEGGGRVANVWLLAAELENMGRRRGGWRRGSGGS